MARKKVVDTAEFQDAVSAAVTERLEAFKADLFAAASQPAAPASSGGGAADLLGDVLSKLTMNLQAVNQQGQRNKPLSPEEVMKREHAHNRMVDLITSTRALPPGERPSYKLIAKTYLNERFIEPFRIVDKRAVPTEISWTGVPNDSMVPLNNSAEQIFNAWRETTGGQTMLIPTADNRPYWVTSAGLTVKGDPPKRQHVAGEARFDAEVIVDGGDNSNPNAPQVAVLGTVARKAITNAVTGAHQG